jgi:hypothetical protein
MPNTKPTKAQSLPLDLLMLYDSFSEFEACCAFFCDSVAALSSHRVDWIDESSAEGLRFFAQRLKEKSTALKSEVEVI